jgi:hypothetical protein
MAINQCLVNIYVLEGLMNGGCDIDMLQIEVYKRRNTARRNLDGLEESQINKIISMIDIIPCRKCDREFVSINKKSVRICDHCKQNLPPDYGFDGIGNALGMNSPSNKYRGSI